MQKTHMYSILFICAALLCMVLPQTGLSEERQKGFPKENILHAYNFPDGSFVVDGIASGSAGERFIRKHHANGDVLWENRYAGMGFEGAFVGFGICSDGRSWFASREYVDEANPSPITFTLLAEDGALERNSAMPPGTKYVHFDGQHLYVLGMYEQANERLIRKVPPIVPALLQLDMDEDISMADGCNWFLALEDLCRDFEIKHHSIDLLPAKDGLLLAMKRAGYSSHTPLFFINAHGNATAMLQSTSNAFYLPDGSSITVNEVIDVSSYSDTHIIQRTMTDGSLALSAAVKVDPHTGIQDMQAVNDGYWFVARIWISSFSSDTNDALQARIDAPIFFKVDTQGNLLYKARVEGLGIERQSVCFEYLLNGQPLVSYSTMDADGKRTYHQTPLDVLLEDAIEIDTAWTILDVYNAEASKEDV